MPKTTSVLQKLYRLISIRLRSEKEIRDYLQGKKLYSEQAIETATQKLKELRLLNDKEFAKAWVEARSKKKGIRAIKQELFQKGISKEIIDEVTIQNIQGTNEKETATRLLERKIDAWKNLEPLKFKKKAFEFLMRRGFEYEIVTDIIEKYIKREYD